MKKTHNNTMQLLLALVCILMLNVTAKGTDFYHSATITSGQSYSLVSVYDSPPQQTTIEFYGFSDELVTHNSSVVNIYSDWFSGGGMSHFGQSSPVYSNLYDSSTVNVYTGGGFNGWTACFLSLYNTSVLNVNGGMVSAFTQLYNHSTANLNGGEISLLWLYDYSVLNLYKGIVDTFGENYVIPATATVNIYGYGFNYTPYGQWWDIGDGWWVSALTGHSFDGGSITYYGLPDPATNANIHLIPEPATILLFLIGIAGTRKVHRQIK